jgi:hypothetical protein
MTELPAALAELERLWRDAGVPVDDHFGPGLAASTVSERLAQARLPAPTEIVEWFSWLEASPPVMRGRAPIGPSRWFALSLDEALTDREMRMEGARVGAEDFDDPAYPPSHWWEPTWLPIANDLGPGSLAVDLGSDPATVPVRDIEWDDPEEFRTIQAATLHEAVMIWTHFMTTGEWTWSPTTSRWEGDFRSPPADAQTGSLMR